jgi:DNA-binding protein HU-beta
MAKSSTKSQIAASVAETVGITKKQAVETIEALVALAYKIAKNKFTLPGLGKLVLVNRKARMGRNPATGEAIKIPAKRVVKSVSLGLSSTSRISIGRAPRLAASDPSAASSPPPVS